MQVEVSKYTEGVNDKALRPNGLPKSLIRYDGEHVYSRCYWMWLWLHLIIILSCVSARQKEKALSLITEVVQTVKHPESHIQAIIHDTISNHEEQGSFNLDYILPKSAETPNRNTPNRQNRWLDSRGDVSQSSSCQEEDKQYRKSRRLSLMRWFSFIYHCFIMVRLMLHCHLREIYSMCLGVYYANIFIQGWLRNL